MKTAFRHLPAAFVALGVFAFAVYFAGAHGPVSASVVAVDATEAMQITGGQSSPCGTGTSSYEEACGSATCPGATLPSDCGNVAFYESASGQGYTIENCNAACTVCNTGATCDTFFDVPHRRRLICSQPG